jgi:hypothetical protein
MDSFNKESGFVVVASSELELVSGGKGSSDSTGSSTNTGTGYSDGCNGGCGNGCDCGCSN